MDDYVIHTGVFLAMTREHFGILTMGILKSSWVYKSQYHHHLAYLTET